MTNDKLYRFAHDLFAAWARAGEDIEAFMAFFADDVRVELMVREGMMQGVPSHYDKASWRAQAIAESKVSELIQDITHVIGDESGLAIEATGRLEIAGRPYRNRYCYVAELTNGRISTFRMYLDTLYAAEAVKWLVDAHQPVPGDKG
jgi:ketosteroid isomerase-like protein